MMKPVRMALAFLTLAAPVVAQDYPLTIEHKFGTIIIEAQPERIATVDYAGADNILALGHQPLTARYWFGASAIWPWAQDLLAVEPEILRGQLNFEQIASTDPDVIIAIRSGITAEEYEQLARIAPVVAVPKGTGDYELTWDERAMLVGRVLGKQAEAAVRIDEIRARLASVGDSHPDWAGNTFAMTTYWDGSVGLYSANDTSVSLMAAMGLSIHPAVEELTTPGGFYITLSEERLADIDGDLLFWYTSDAARESIEALEIRRLMNVYREGREIFLPDTSRANGALSHGTLLSLPEAIDRLAPLIEMAIDGDPATPVPMPE
jgi:iron complex transport system substrate-binding protein